LDGSLLFYGRRHCGSDARNSCLLRYVDGSGSQKADIVISSKDRNQSKEESGKKRDPTLTIKTQLHVSQLKP